MTETGTLSQREKQILNLIAEDLTSRQIAILLSISVKTIEFYRQESKINLNTNGIAGMVRYAISTGLLEFLMSECAECRKLERELDGAAVEYFKISLNHEPHNELMKAI